MGTGLRVAAQGSTGHIFEGLGRGFKGFRLEGCRRFQVWVVGCCMVFA